MLENGFYKNGNNVIWTEVCTTVHHYIWHVLTQQQMMQIFKGANISKW